MRVILIEEDRFAEIAALMKAECVSLAEEARTAERLGWDKAIWKTACDEAHRSMHFHFVRWAQSHGASCVMK
jgi:hypothetical protein